MTEPLLTETSEGVTFEVRVIPGASRCALVVEDDGRVRVRIDAPPVEGAANDRLVRYLAKEVFGVPRGAVHLVRGATSRTKHVAVNLPLDDVRLALSKKART